MKDIDGVLSRAQKAAAKKALATELSNALRHEICLVAQREARKFIKSKKEEIQNAVRKEFSSSLPKLIKEIVAAAVKKTYLYIQ